MSFVSQLKLSNYRNYRSAVLENISGGIVVLSGPNGAGKTNILEALSLLSPGRGLRGAGLAEMQNNAAGEPAWAVSATVETGSSGTTKIGTGLDPATGKRLVRINGESQRGQSVLAEYLSCVWLTPQMDRIFLDSAGARRRFLDRLVFTFDPGHSGRVSRYENVLGQRSKLLREGKGDDKWLAALEAQIAETGVAIAAARVDYCERLRHACSSCQGNENGVFPEAVVNISGSLEESLQKGTALAVEEMFRKQLAKMRTGDALAGGAGTGPHRSDFLVFHAGTRAPASQCSTGEQKALLTGMIIAHSRLITAERGMPPILLLDEVAAHLDDCRRRLLYEILSGMNCQVWLTGTDEKIFYGIDKNTQFFEVQDSKIRAGGEP